MKNLQPFIIINPATLNLETIQLPLNCVECGRAITPIIYNYSKHNYLDKPCIHYATFPSVWNNRIQNKESSIKKDGLNCKSCKDFFPFSEPNQKDGISLICWSCRN